MPVTQISAQNAFELLKNDPNSILVDVRTVEEFGSVGIVDAGQFNDRMILLPWQTLPLMEQNPHFTKTLENSLSKVFADKSKEASIVFMCRSGNRSNNAALHASHLGYKNCYNMIAGFDNWKAISLPWRKK